jgi:hypothetical protein
MYGDIDRFKHYTAYALLIKSAGRKEGTKCDAEAFYLLKYIRQVLEPESVKIISTEDEWSCRRVQKTAQ